MNHWRPMVLFSVMLAAVFLLNEAKLFILDITVIVSDRFGVFRPLVSYSIGSFMVFFIGCVPFAAIELLSAQKDKKIDRLRSYKFPLLIWAFYAILSNLVVVFSTMTTKYFPIEAYFSQPDLPDWLHIITFIILIDFFGYWFHRLEHFSPTLWKFHTTHHSLKNINVFNQYGHWFEGMFRFLCIYLPVSILLPTPDLSTSAIVVIWASWLIYLHSDNPKLALPRWARSIFVDNLYHHYHHGSKERYHNSNFGTVLSIWDHIFGTANLPENQEFPETGLDDILPPESIKEYFVHPFRTK